MSAGKGRSQAFDAIVAQSKTDRKRLDCRRHGPDLERPFKGPRVSFVAGTGIVAVLALMITLPIDTWVRLAVWLVIGLAICFAYARPHALTQMAEVRAGGEPAADA